MKNLKELWSAVLEGQEEQKNNYYATSSSNWSSW